MHMHKYFICKICASEVGPTQTGHSPFLFSTWLLALWVYLQVASNPLHTCPVCSWTSLPRITNSGSRFIENCSCRAWNKLISINPYSLLYCYCQMDRRDRQGDLHPNRFIPSSNHSFNTYFLSAYHVVQKPDIFLGVTELTA